MAEVTKKNKHTMNIIRLLVAAGAFYLAFRGVDMKQMFVNFSKLKPIVIAAAIVMSLAGQLVFVFRWLLLLKIQDISIKYVQAMKLHFVGLYYNICLPSSVGGDALRMWYVTKHTDKKMEAALSVLVDRIMGMICTFMIIFVAYWFMPGGDTKLKFEFDIIPTLIKAVLAVVILFVLAGITLFAMYKIRRFRPILFKYGFIFMLKWKMWSSRFITAIKLYCSKPFTLLFALALGFTCQALPITALYLVGRNLGIEANLKYYFIFFPLSWIMGIIPISIGGAGVVELGLREMFSKVAAVTSEQGLGLGLAQRIIWLLTSIPGVIIHISGKHLPEEERIEPK
ncbi:MAG: lysylphosphatidylglycerol synthase transmembrane domain-containing protein [Phycisphaerales bacterium]